MKTTTIKRQTMKNVRAAVVRRLQFSIVLAAATIYVGAILYSSYQKQFQDVSTMAKDKTEMFKKEATEKITARRKETARSTGRLLRLVDNQRRIFEEANANQRARLNELETDLRAAQSIADAVYNWKQKRQGNHTR